MQLKNSYVDEAHQRPQEGEFTRGLGTPKSTYSISVTSHKQDQDYSLQSFKLYT
jgi:hypothetical protein